MSGSSVGAKLLIGGTGLLLVLYLVLHLAGNLLLFAGAGTFNRYAASLTSNPMTVLLEIGLAVVFSLHAVRALSITLRNRRARPTPYVVRARARHTSRVNVASTTMALSGIVIVLFVPIHIWMFRFGAAARIPGADVRDLFGVVVGALRSPLVAGFYVVAMFAVGLHLWHGGASALQSLGFASTRSTSVIRAMTRPLAVVIAGGFISIVVWVALGGGR